MSTIELAPCNGGRCAVCSACDVDGVTTVPVVVHAGAAVGVSDVPARAVRDHVHRFGGDRRVWRPGVALCCLCVLAVSPAA